MGGSGIARLSTLTAAFVLLLAAAPAAATPPPQPPQAGQWRPASCAVGEITDFAFGTDPQSNAVLAMSGWIQPCESGDAGTGFIAIRYYATGSEYRGARPYESSSAPTPFDVLLDLRRGAGVLGLPHAVCLAYDVEGRVACLAIDVDYGDPDAPPVVKPIPTDDDRVLPITRPVPNPTCGTCL